MGLDHDFNPRRLERYLLTSWESGATPVVLLSKADLVTNASSRVNEIESLAPGVPVHAISAVIRELEDGQRLMPDVAALDQYLGVGRLARFWVHRAPASRRSSTPCWAQPS